MAEPQLRNVAITELDRTHNVRRSLGNLAELVKSISDVGVLTPVTVAPKEDGGWYLVAGYRRTAAAEKAGLDTVPALVHTARDSSERLLATLVENLQRLDLDPVEEAGGYRQLVNAGWSQAEVARRVRRSRGHVSRRLRLLTLPDERCWRWSPRGRSPSSTPTPCPASWTRGYKPPP
ncbi:MAG: ParB/RepB/Spo0J family partition protein [bacterium]|nr:ParB/RepB/Spo0J family partition protein [bacterium]